MKELKLILYFIFFFNIAIIGLQGQREAKEPAEEYQEKKTVLVKVYAQEYLTLAKWCKANSFQQEAEEHFKQVLEYEPENKEAKQELKKETSKNGSPPKDIETIRDTYDQKLTALSKKLADEHTKLGVWCKQKKLPEEAEQEFNTAIALYEDHPVARKELNQVKVPGFGWVDKETANKLTQDLREYKGEWLPNEKVEKIRSNWDEAWEIKTEHYVVKTDTTYEKGYELGQLAEDVYQMFFKVFGRFLELKTPKKPLLIYYFKSQKEYKSEFQKVNGREPASSVGIYCGKDRAVYFWGPQKTFSGQGSEKDTMRHECTHQLIGFAGGKMADSWLEEGIACYFESLKRNKSGRLIVGDMGHHRYGAKEGFSAVISIGQFVPLKDFLARRKGDLKEWKTYAQATALARFFLNNQKYREQCVNFIKIHFTDKAIEPIKAFEQSFPTMDIAEFEGEFIAGFAK
jgi:hypothetical protein